MIHTAWAVLALSFLLLCSSTLAVTGGVYYFFFQSTVAMQTSVQVSRGTAGLIAADFSEQIIRDEPRNLQTFPYTVSTDAQSQAVLSLQMVDEEDTPPLLTMITLHNSSSITVQRAFRPRYEWSNGYYLVELEELQGDVSIFVSQAVDRPFRLELRTRDGVRVLIDDPGQYTIERSDTRTRLTTRQGRAVLISPQQQASKLVTPGNAGVYLQERVEPILVESPRNLLEHGLFAFEGTLRWGCSDEYDAPPSGDFYSDAWQGRTGLRLVRGDEATSHGQTGCWQDLGEDGISVTEYTYLELQTSFLINYQSLSDCGVDGSECPMMLRVDYTDADGVEREWIHGFYYRDDPNPAYASYPPRCTSCIQDHDQINEKVWYSYSTGNFFSLFPPESRPEVINRVTLYASGHEYDVFVGEILLLAGYAEVVPPSANLTTPED
jgi:hypothetical protein